MTIIWMISLSLFTGVLVAGLWKWCKGGPKKELKVLASIIIVILFGTLTLSSIGMFNSASFNGGTEYVYTSTVEQVYKSSLESDTYYVTTPGNDSLQELQVNSIVHGDQNMVVTIFYNNGEKTTVLIVENIEKIPVLPVFNP